MKQLTNGTLVAGGIFVVARPRIERPSGLWAQHDAITGLPFQHIRDSRLSSMRMIRKPLHIEFYEQVLGGYQRNETHCTLFNVEMVEHQEWGEVSEAH